MAERVPRIAITPTPALRQTLMELHGLSGMSLSAICAGLLEEIQPALAAQIEALRAIKETPDKARELVKTYAMEQVGVIAQTVMDFEQEEDQRTMAAKLKKQKRRRANAPP
jgi:hypothetical protein